MTLNELRDLIATSTPLARLNPHLSDSKPERDQEATLDGSVQGKEEGMGRVRVRFIGYRVRPLDPDNFAASCKDCIDFLRRVKLIKDDDPASIILETEQRRVKTFAEEKTVVELANDGGSMLDPPTGSAQRRAEIDAAFVRAGHKPENKDCDHRQYDSTKHGRYCPCGTCMPEIEPNDGTERRAEKNL